MVYGSMYRREQGGVFQVKEKFDIYRGHSDIIHEIPVQIEQHTDIEIRAQSSASAANISAGFDLLLCPGD